MTLLRTTAMMSKVLANMHDNSANIAKFKETFNGDNKDTIRFIFCIRRYEQIAHFQDPQSLFNKIYHSLPTHIQIKLARDKEKVISDQRSQLNAASTAEDRAKADIYSSETLQEFFIRNYRPTIYRGGIFAQLHRIKMRNNEDPSAVIDRISSAVGYARKTISLLNNTITDKADEIRTITTGDITELLSRVFCGNDNGNTGEINKLMRKRIRDSKPVYHNVTKFKPYYDIANAVVSDIGSQWYIRDPKYRIKHYDPIPLPLWETTRNNSKQQSNPNKLKQTPQIQQAPRRGKKRSHYQSQSTPNFQPPSKRQKYTPSKTKPHPNIQCFRCGKIGHYSRECQSQYDINNQFLHPNAMRQPHQWKYRNKYPNKPQKPTNPTQNKPQYYTPKYQQKPPAWNKYSQSSSKPSQTPYNPTSNSSQPTSQQTPSPNLFSLISEIHKEASADAHINPKLLELIHTLNNNHNNHNDSNDPQPRQYS